MDKDHEDSLEERRSRLADRLAEAQTPGSDEGSLSERDRKGYSQALKISSEFIAAIIVGAMLGYLLDYFAATKPWGLMVFLLLGFCAGVMNVLRVVGVVKSPHPVDRIGKMHERENKRQSPDRRSE
jgi:ATP synthase protein I